MIIASCFVEKKIQVNELTMIDLDGSQFVNEGMTSITIVPDAGVDPIDVSATLNLKWQYEVEGEKTITVVFTGEENTKTIDKKILVLTVEEDLLFSDDNDLVVNEDDILKFCRNGKNSFNDKSRLSQEMILNELSKRRIFKNDGSLYTKTDVANIQCIKDWSKFLTLSTIFGGISNEVDDIYSIKSSKYLAMAKEESARAYIELKQTETSEPVKYDIMSGRMVRR